MNTLWGTKNAADFTGTQGYDGEDIGLANDIAAAQTTGALAALGNGVLRGGVVTAGVGLSVNIAPVLAIALHSVTGACALELTELATPRTVPASSTRNLFLEIRATGEVATDSRATREPLRTLSTLESIDGAVLLATITTDANGVTNIIDRRKFEATGQQPAIAVANGTLADATRALNEVIIALGKLGKIATP